MYNNTPNKIIRVATYLRVSSDKQAKSGDSLRDQAETLTEYINKNENMILFDTYMDDGVSGQKIDRDDFSRLLDDIRADKIDLIIFTRLDRWFRSVKHYLNTQTILDKHNVSWTAVSQPFFDTSTAHGRAFVQQSMVWAELEANMDSERINAVFQNKVANGEVITGNPPVGYMVENKHLVFDPVKAPMVIKMFDTFIKTSNLSAVYRMLLDDYGIMRNPSTIRKMFKKRIYTGEYRGNKNYCPALIDKNKFDHVQNLLSKNIKCSQKHEYIFSAMVKCECCGNAMSAHQISTRGRTRKDGTFARYQHSGYRCKRRYDLKDCCNKKIIYESVLERWMLEHLHENIETYITEYDIASRPAMDNTAKIKSIEKKLSKLKELFLNDLISLDEYKLDKSNLENQLSLLPSCIAPVKDLKHINNVLNTDIDSIYTTFTIDEKQRFWRSFIDCIYVDDKRNFRVKFL
ncbi:recombinase family protein [uncultured Robinsoniella sp.]|uniref:recombinase family protein n=1 Tax=uncultured Robinsoniella sp. TaxID=904190 RepID=UPI00291322DB|nr:recombinase family protein [Clostridiales bacterium]